MTYPSSRPRLSTTTSRHSRRLSLSLAVAASLAFAASLALPAFSIRIMGRAGPWEGWRLMAAALGAGFSAPFEAGGTTAFKAGCVVLAISALLNALFVAAPFVIWRAPTGGLRIAIGRASVAGLLFATMAPFVFGDAFDAFDSTPLFGYFAWLAAYALLAGAVLVQARGARPSINA